MNKAKAKRITFFSKEAIECPVCGASFHKEELLSGSGRLIAGDITDELRRLYEPSKKFGAIYPLIYYITVCPACNYAAFPKDFLEQNSEPDIVDRLREQRKRRVTDISLLFNSLDFTSARGIEEGTASYVLAMMCYDCSKRLFAPSIKQGISAVRAAWCFGDLHRNQPDQNYDYLAKLFYRKSLFFYHLAVEKEQTGGESMGSVVHLGPDVDKNYGYDGVLYMTGLLEFKYGPQKDPAKRIEYLDRARKIISRVHGMGRASKSKPSIILDKAKDMHHILGEQISILEGDGPAE
jgi:uncharacterized protein (DUF2225 family)